MVGSRFYGKKHMGVGMGYYPEVPFGRAIREGFLDSISTSLSSLYLVSWHFLLLCV